MVDLFGGPVHAVATSALIVPREPALVNAAWRRWRFGAQSGWMELATTRRWLIALTVSAVPLALLLESLLRSLLLPPDFEEVRAWLEPTMTAAAWWLMGLCAVVGVACVLLQARWSRRSVSRLGPQSEAEAPERACIGVFIITASLAQGPALLASLTFLLGAQLLPVLLAVAWSTASVTTQALRIRATVAG